MEDRICITPTGPELLIRHGDAPAVYDPVQVVLTGTIQAPADYAENRKSTIPKLGAHVVANYTKRTIMLRVNDTDRFGAQVTGTLELHPDLRALNINTTRTYTQKDLYELLKFKGAWFKNRDEHMALLSKLKSFEAKVSQEFQNANDMKGNAAYKKVTEIKTNLDLEFKLNMPIFAGFDANEFDVEICVDMENGAVKFWLESVALHNDIVSSTEEIFEKEIERLQEYAIVRQY